MPAWLAAISLWKFLEFLMMQECKMSSLTRFREQKLSFLVAGMW
jgi:hypothetical protein